MDNVILNQPYISDSLQQSDSLFKGVYELHSASSNHQDMDEKAIATQLFFALIDSSHFKNDTDIQEFLRNLDKISRQKAFDRLNITSSKEANHKHIPEVVTLFDIDQSTRKKETNPNRGYERFNCEQYIFKPLKSYQHDLAQAVEAHFAGARYQTCILQMPTGSGKTRTAMDIVCETLRTGQDVLWIANSEELCDQAFQSFIETWHFLKNRPSDAINHLRYRRTASQDSVEATFHVTSIQSIATQSLESSLEKLSRRAIDIANLNLVVIDEAHIATAKTYKNALLACTHSGANLLGLTATPGRALKTTNHRENEDFSEFFGHKIFSLELGENTIDKLTDQGILAVANYVAVEGAILEQVLDQEQIENLLNSKDIPAEALAILGRDISRNQQILDILSAELSAGKSVLYFATSVENSKIITTSLRMRGFSAAHIDGQTGPSREVKIQNFKDGKTQLLSNFGVLSTGFDAPKTDVVFIARPTKSIVLYSQMIGRGLRGPVLGGTPQCEIFTVLDNLNDLPANTDIYDYFADYFTES
jgi:DNA repair protein RadD